MTTPKTTEIETVPQPKNFCVEEYARSVFQMYDAEN